MLSVSDLKALKMIDPEKLVRENVRNLTPYSSARDEFKGKSGIFMDANENPFGKLNRYPDPYQQELKGAIAGIKGVAEEMTFLGNGSDEIIDLCFRIFCNPGKDKVLIFTPTYGMYEVSAAINDVEINRIPLTDDFQIDMDNTRKVLDDPLLKLIFICSPNNPTSNTMKFTDIEEILNRSQGIVVIDEAYIDFSERPSLLPLLATYNNLIIMHTFSKAFGLAAARVGMAFSNEGILRYFNKMKPPYNISTINQKAVLNKLNNLQVVRSQVVRIITERKRLADKLAESELVIKVFPSDANFLLVRVKNANKIYNELVARNIIVRNRNSVIRDCLRITVGRKSENNKLVKALNDIAHLVSD